MDYFSYYLKVAKHLNMKKTGETVKENGAIQYTPEEADGS